MTHTSSPRTLEMDLAVWSLYFLSPHLYKCICHIPSVEPGIREMNVCPAYLVLIVFPIPPASSGTYPPSANPSSNMLRLSTPHFPPDTSLLLLLARPVGDLAIHDAFSHWPREKVCPTQGLPALSGC